MAVSIREATVSDAGRIADLTSQLGYDVDVPTAESRVARILARRDQHLWIAELDGRPAGWIHVAVADYVESGPFVIIGGLVVDRQQRRHGIGTALMKHAEAWATSEGFSLVRLQSSSIRTAAHRFYERLGYTNVKTQFAFVKSLDAADDLSRRRFVPRVDP